MVVVGAARVGREPDSVAEEVGGVVEVDVHLLLRYALAEEAQVLGEAVEASVGVGRERAEGSKQ